MVALREDRSLDRLADRRRMILIAERKDKTLWEMNPDRKARRES
jgi:hypothetical protein